MVLVEPISSLLISLASSATTGEPASLLDGTSRFVSLSAPLPRFPAIMFERTTLQVDPVVALGSFGRGRPGAFHSFPPPPQPHYSSVLLPGVARGTTSAIRIPFSPPHVGQSPVRPSISQDRSCTLLARLRGGKRSGGSSRSLPLPLRSLTSEWWLGRRSSGFASASCIGAAVQATGLSTPPLLDVVGELWIDYWVASDFDSRCRSNGRMAKGRANNLHDEERTQHTTQHTNQSTKPNDRTLQASFRACWHREQHGCRYVDRTGRQQGFLSWMDWGCLPIDACAIMIPHALSNQIVPWRAGKNQKKASKGRKGGKKKP